MLREQRLRKQQVADKIGHEEYIYRLNGDPFSEQADIRVRPQGDYQPRRGQDGNGRVQSPPMGFDDGQRRDQQNRAAALRSPSPGNAGMVPYQNNNFPTSPVQAFPQGNYGGGYGGANMKNNGGGNYAAARYPPVSAAAPVMRVIAPVQELPSPLPPVYQPKPPLNFRGMNPAPSAAGMGMGSPAAAYYPSPSAGFGGGGIAIEDWRSPVAADSLSPPSQLHLSPTSLPPIVSQRDGNNHNNPGSGGVFIVGSGAMVEVAERHREKMQARQRAIEIQQENARQMLERQLRREDERAREIREDRLAEARLQRERDEVAAREKAEIQRERLEQEAKTAGPQTAENALLKFRKETEERRASEAAARRRKSSNNNNDDNSAQAPAATPAPSAAAAEDRQSSAGIRSPPLPAASPAPALLPPTETSSMSQAPQLFDRRQPVTFASALHPTAVTAAARPPSSHLNLSFSSAVGGLNGGAGLLSSPAASPAPTGANPYNFPALLQQHQQRARAETEAIHAELRHITHLIEAQQLSEAAARCAPSLHWSSGTPPSSPAGAGTFLTSGQPSPMQSPRSVSTGSGGANGHYFHVSMAQPQRSTPPLPPSAGMMAGANLARTFTAGGTMLPRPVSPTGVAVPPFTPLNGFYQSSLNRSPPAQSNGAVFYSGPLTGSGHIPLMPGAGEAAHVQPGAFAESLELATEPSRFVMPPSTASAAGGEQGMLSPLSLLLDRTPPPHVGPAERPGTGRPDHGAIPPPQPQRSPSPPTAALLTGEGAPATPSPPSAAALAAVPSLASSLSSVPRAAAQTPSAPEQTVFPPQATPLMPADLVAGEVMEEYDDDSTSRDGSSDHGPGWLREL